MKTNIISGILLAFICVSCGKDVNIQSAPNTPSLISIEEAQNIVAENLATTEYYSQYYLLDSPNFDERVREITWGPVKLIRIIPDGKIYKEEMYYYLLAGVLSDGRMLAANTVNAVTGKILSGQLWVNERADYIKMASEEQAVEYVSQKSGMLSDDLRVSRVYFDQPFSESLILSWKYLVEVFDDELGARGVESDAYYLVDPYLIGESETMVLKNDNGFLAKFGKLNRLFKYSDNKILLSEWGKLADKGADSIELIGLD